MTHPLTPREKVAQIIKEKVSGPHFTEPSFFVAMEKDRFAAAAAILTALASDSGDHAELAELREHRITADLSALIARLEAMGRAHRAHESGLQKRISAGDRSVSLQDPGNAARQAETCEQAVLILRAQQGEG